MMNRCAGNEAEREARLRVLRAMPYGEYLRTAHWQDIRRIALAYAGHRCQLCNSGGILHVHHRTYERFGAEMMSDLVVLCERCHRLFHDHAGPEGSVTPGESNHD